MLFEIVLARGVDPTSLLSEDVVRDTGVKLMTWEQARAAGFAGLPEPAADRTIRYLSASGRDAKFLHHVLENNVNVASMRVYEVE